MANRRNPRHLGFLTSRKPRSRGCPSENPHKGTDAFVRPASEARRPGTSRDHPSKSTLKTAPHPCINLTTDPVPDTPTTPGSPPQPRGPTIIAAGLLLAALAVVVLYTSRRAFLSPVAMVVVAAIGVAALLLQRRLRPDLYSSAQSSTPPDTLNRAPLRLNALGVAFAIAAVFADVLRLNPALMLISALAAVISFAISAVIVLKALRKPRPEKDS
jgi:hypothetical protein